MAIGLGFAAVLALATGVAQVDPEVLLKRAVARVEQSTRSLPRFTCLESVERGVYSPGNSQLVVRGLTANRWPDFKDRFVLARSDRFRLEFAVFDGRQLFSWPGAGAFEHTKPEELILDGASSAGEFGPFAISVFLADADPASFEALPTAGEYRYLVPRERSHFLMRFAQKQAPMAFEGTILVDAISGNLKQLVVSFPKPPKGSGIQNGQIVTEYELTKVGEGTFLLPSRSTTTLVFDQNDVKVNQTQYSGCREFKSSAAILFDADSSKVLAPSRAGTPPPVEPVAPGVEFWTKLRTKVDTATSFAGDRVEAEVTRAVTDGNGLVVPMGAILSGRIIHLQRTFVPRTKVEMLIEFEYAEFDGKRVPVTLGSRGPAEIQALRAKERVALKPAVLGAQGKFAGITLFDTDHLHWDSHTIWVWRSK